MRRVHFILLVVLLAGAAGQAARATPPGSAPDELVLSVGSVASPNGDRVKDMVRVEVGVAAPSAVTVTVEKAGSTIATLAASVAVDAGTLRLKWDGRDDDGKVVPDGLYVVAATAADPDGAESAARATVRIDTRPPRLKWLTLRDRPGAGPLHARYRVADASASLKVALEVRDSSGRHWISARRPEARGAHDEPWPLRGPDGRRLAPDAYEVDLLATDDAGNAASSPVRSILVEYPVRAHVIRRVDGAGRRIALTFDDCNDAAAWTSILETLEAHSVQASFFCLGSQVERHAAQARRALRDGDTIGNHTWTHPSLPTLSSAEVKREVERTTEAWWRLARTAPMPYFRPPYGALSPTAVAAIGGEGYSRIVLWDVDTQDWSRPGVDAIVERATGPARAGSIVLLHVLPQTAAALPEILARLSVHGLEPVSVDRLLRR
jgi:peptidoglycan/xylan/chitin deacetylase (PgdA/CDA1 family)